MEGNTARGASSPAKPACCVGGEFGEEGERGWAEAEPLKKDEETKREK